VIASYAAVGFDGFVGISRSFSLFGLGKKFTCRGFIGRCRDGVLGMHQQRMHDKKKAEHREEKSRHRSHKGQEGNEHFRRRQAVGRRLTGEKCGGQSARMQGKKMRRRVSRRLGAIVGLKLVELSWALIRCVGWSARGVAGRSIYSGFFSVLFDNERWMKTLFRR